MDLNTITSVVRPVTRADLPRWEATDAWLGGGTWLFSEPQTHLTRLIDLTDFRWPAITVHETCVEIAATCTVAQLAAFTCPPDWTAAHLIEKCCRAFLASFKVWKTATVGGNLCLALPAGPMISLMAALDGVCIIWCPDGRERRVAARDFVTGNQSTVLQPGELLRAIDIPVPMMRRRASFRQMSLTPLGRSAALLIGTRANDGAFDLTITAATIRPVRVAFDAIPDRAALVAAIAALPSELSHADVHGKPDWRRHLVQLLAEDIRVELGELGS